MTDLNQLRIKINEVDSKLISLLKERIEISKKIGKYKEENNLEIFDPNREQEIINNFTKFSGNANKKEKVYIEKFLKTLMDISKEVQNSFDTPILRDTSRLSKFSEQKKKTINSLNIKKEKLNFGLLGEKLSHSFSPLIHNFIFENLKIKAEYNLFEIPKNEIQNFKEKMIKENILGVNITVPYKQNFIDNLDFISDRAKKIGAINLLYLKNNKFYGDNTDYLGFKETLIQNKINIQDKNIYIIGKGGASLAVKTVLKDLGIKNICSLYRKDKNSPIIFPESISTKPEKNIIINTTPVGMYPNVDSNIIPKEFLKNFSVAIDLIYNPLETVFLKEAKKLNLKTINGLTMLIEQAIKTDEILLDIKIDEILKKELYEYIENSI